MDDLISRKALLTEFSNLDPPGFESSVAGIVAIKKIKAAPYVDAVKVETIEAWLYAIAMNNVGCPVKDFATACEELITRLDGLRTFAKEGRTDGN